MKNCFEKNNGLSKVNLDTAVERVYFRNDSIDLLTQDKTTRGGSQFPTKEIKKKALLFFHRNVN